LKIRIGPFADAAAIPAAGILFLAAALAALTLLIVLTLRGPGGGGGLLLVSPREDFVFNQRSLDRVLGEEFLFTYELRRQLRASAGPAAGYPVTVIETNSLYPLLLSCPPRRGSFFSTAAEKERSGHAVLNLAAAARLFGGLDLAGGAAPGRAAGFRMGGESWLVSGVVDDGEDESPRIYIPASLRGEGPRSLLIRSGGGAGEARVKELLQTLGAGELSHRFFDLSGAAGLRLGLALRILGCLLLALFARRRLRALGAALSLLRGRLREEYAAQLLRSAGTARLLAPRIPDLALLAGGAFLGLRLLRRILNACFRLRDLPPLGDLFSAGEFPALLAALRSHDRWESAALSLFLAALGLALVFLRPRKRRRPLV
jgi:hypothetical protein